MNSANDILTGPMTKNNFAERLRTFIDKRKAAKDEGPIIRATRMPDDLQKIRRKS